MGATRSCLSAAGLGHAVRDLAIARAARRLPGATISWLAGDVARELLARTADAAGGGTLHHRATILESVSQASHQPASSRYVIRPLRAMRLLRISSTI